MGARKDGRLRAILGACVVLITTIMLWDGGPAAGWPGPSQEGTSWASAPASNASPDTRRQSRSLERKLAHVGPGETLVLRPGTYGARGTSTRFRRSGTKKAPITVRGMPGRPRPRLLGAMRITGSHLRIRRVVFDGPTGPVQPPTAANPGGEQVQVAIGYDTLAVRDVTISESVVRNSDWHAGIYLVGVRNIRIFRNHIHHNGDAGDPAQANQSHGIYWDSGNGVIANNLIDHNLARGVQLSPGASRTKVAHNTLVANGRAGVLLGGSASRNLIANNILAYNGDQAIRSFGLTGTGNLARTNLAWANGGNPAEPSPGLVIQNTIEARPRFARGSFELRPTSRAINAAAHLGSVSVDYYGRHRPIGRASDLGAHESG